MTLSSTIKWRPKAHSIIFIVSPFLVTLLFLPSTSIPPDSLISAARKGTMDNLNLQTLIAAATNRTRDITPLDRLAKAMNESRAEFYDRYGGREQAIDILRRSVRPLGNLNSTSHRILGAAASGEPLVFSFAGYSVTAGRGNYFSQSFPFVLGNILQPVLALLGVKLTIRNAGIGGVPSFPYAFCFSHFLGQDPDVISWDFGMNENKFNHLFEAYLRHAQTQLPRRPMVILIDGDDQSRCNTLQHYVESEGLPADAICVKVPSVVVGPELLRLNSSGFQLWGEFGAPEGCPGQTSWHPGKKEHEMLGWVMAMHFLDAIELVSDTMLTDSRWFELHESVKHLAAPTFGSPITMIPDNLPAITNLLYGKDNKIGHVECRTNFLPAVDERNLLPSIVVSGWNENITADTILHERSEADYLSGWVLDISDDERRVTLNAKSCSMGYVDAKVTLYGTADSGTIRLWLPLEHSSDRYSSPHRRDDDDESTSSLRGVRAVVICEINEWRPLSACKLDTDLEYTVGGVPEVNVTMMNGAGGYLGRRLCASLAIPEAAQLIALKDVEIEGESISWAVKERLGGRGERYGLLVDVKAKSHVTRESGACAIAHVVWK